METLLMVLLAKPNSDGNELLTILVGDTNNWRIFLISCETYNSSHAKTNGDFAFPKAYKKQYQTLAYEKYFLVLNHPEGHWIFKYLIKKDTGSPSVFMWCEKTDLYISTSLSHCSRLYFFNAFRLNG